MPLLFFTFYLFNQGFPIKTETMRGFDTYYVFIKKELFEIRNVFYLKCHKRECYSGVP